MPTTERDYQFGFAATHPGTAFNESARVPKGLKISAVLADYFGRSLASKRMLDVGSSTGIVTHVVSGDVRSTIGIDIDAPAVSHAAAKYGSDKLAFCQASSQQLPFPDGSFDVVLCAHVYEHVPNPELMMREIHRVLSPGGICFFAAGNRIRWMEPHYRLPLLSVIPKSLAHRVLKWLGRGDHYYETHLTLWGLRRLVRSFEIIDYTQRIIDEPSRFAAGDMIRQGSLKHRIASWTCRLVPCICPTYIWLLRERPA